MNANEKLTALADEVRELSGTTTTKGLDDMKNDVDAANAEIAEQVALISQITAALEGKTSGGGGEEVTEETNAYTAKLETLETAITALETELEGKASSGSGGNIETCTVTMNVWADYSDSYDFYYTDATGKVQKVHVQESYIGELICAKGTIMYFYHLCSEGGYTHFVGNIQGEIEILSEKKFEGSTSSPAILINGNGSLSY